MKQISNIEDCLELVAGLSINGPTIKIEPTDATIMHSIARQAGRNIGLTDRQYNLMREKLLKYESQFIDHGFTNFHDCIVTTRNPLRHIDRAKTVTVSKIDGLDYIEVKFPFNKKTINVIQTLASKMSNRQDYKHDNGSNSHKFVLTELNIYEVINAIKDKDFVIDDNLLDAYNEIVGMIAHPENYIPCINNNQVCNISEDLKTIIVNDVGDISSNIVKVIDRRHRYGLRLLDSIKTENLTDTIVNRENTSILLSNKEHTPEQIFCSINELGRYPVVVLIDEKRAEEQLRTVHREVNRYVNNSEQSVLFRKDGQDPFNEYIKEQSLNNWVDSSTKVVYISKDKLPKLLLKGDFMPITAFSFDSNIHRQVDSYVQNHCDLVIFNDSEMSPIRKYSNYYGYM